MQKFMKLYSPIIKSGYSTRSAASSGKKHRVVKHHVPAVIPTCAGGRERWRMLHEVVKHLSICQFPCPLCGEIMDYLLYAFPTS